MRRGRRLVAAAWILGVLAGTIARSNAEILWDSDFEGSHDAIAIGSNIGTNLVSDPLSAGQGGVLQITDTGAQSGAVQWGEIRRYPFSTALALPVGAVAGTDTYSFTLQCMLPADTVGGNEDQVYLILRWLSGTVDDANKVVSQSIVSFSSTARDTWVTGTLTGTIPAVDLLGRTIDHVIPIISWRDALNGGANNSAGTFGYIDDVVLDVVPEPGSLVLIAFGAIALSRARRRHRS